MTDPGGTLHPLASSQRRESTIDSLRDYVLWQVAIQGGGVVAGLLFVNVLSIREYAFYTLASSSLTLLALLCDLGITNSLPYFRREATLHQRPFVDYVRAATWLRRALLLAGTPVFLGVFGVLSLRNGFRVTETVLTASIVVVAVWFQARVAIDITALRLAGRTRQSYRAELAGTGARLAGAAVMAAASWRYAVLAMVVNAVSSLLTFAVSRGALGRQGNGERARGAALPAIVRYIVPTLPSAIHFAFQGPLVALLSATFGTTQNIAEVGALGRLGLIVGFLTGVIPAVIVPRLSSVLDDQVYRRTYAHYGLVLAVCGATLWLVAHAWPSLFLALLGSEYRGLHDELLLSVGAAGVGVLAAYCSLINQARGWVRWQAGALSVYVVMQGVLIAALPLSTTAGVLLFNLLSAIVGFFAQLLINALGFWRPGWVGLAR